MRRTLAIILLIIIVAELGVMLYFLFTGNSVGIYTALAVNAITVILAYFVIRFDKFSKGEDDDENDQ